MVSVLYAKYNVMPDLAMYGKTIGNGYALTAVVGKKSVMQEAQDSFISSTFWTERIGPTAALTTLEVMKKKKSWKVITERGKLVNKNWLKIAENNKLDISINGLPAISTYKFNYKNHLKYKTFVTQEMLKKGFLASTHFYACTEHTDEIINSYFSALDEVFKMISKCENDILDIDLLLDGPICHSDFQRLN